MSEVRIRPDVSCRFNLQVRDERQAYIALCDAGLTAPPPGEIPSLEGVPWGERFWRKIVDC